MIQAAAAKYHITKLHAEEGSHEYRTSTNVSTVFIILHVTKQ
jgi:hypothetical protein